MTEDLPAVRTLIVDDDFRVADLHAQFVAKVPGFTVSGIAHTAAEALEQVRADRPDLMLLDLYLPDQSGLEIMRRLGEAPTQPGVIVITAARDLAHIRAAITQGAVHYLVKPFRFATLAERLNAFRDLHFRLAELDSDSGEADQQEVDGLFQLMRTGSITTPPKGQSAETLRLVRAAVRHADHDVSAADVAEAIGVSRPTAQRYLSALAQQGLVELRLRYGATGRPEHRYREVRGS
ncbi:response regulator [Microbacterium elymi]|uniref:Transcriptional regulatory protein n=1 Tax=Microbacterium elymi TaxID=2909587 RepID=A0ABY5NKZ2_9MICO|nr:response regulator [Microbacterium elymi]UUT35799.1 response regulator [Microbacterium elymi]